MKYCNCLAILYNSIITALQIYYICSLEQFVSELNCDEMLSGNGTN